VDLKGDKPTFGRSVPHPSDADTIAVAETKAPGFAGALRVAGF